MLGLAPFKRPSGASQAAQWRKSSGPALAHLMDAGIMPCDWPACPHAPMAACLRRAATSALRAGGGSRWTLPNTLQRRRPPGPGNPAAPCGSARARGRRGLGAAHAVRARGRAHQALSRRGPCPAAAARLAFARHGFVLLWKNNMGHAGRDGLGSTQLAIYAWSNVVKCWGLMSASSHNSSRQRASLALGSGYVGSLARCCMVSSLPGGLFGIFISDLAIQVHPILIK